MEPPIDGEALEVANEKTIPGVLARNHPSLWPAESFPCGGPRRIQPTNPTMLRHVRARQAVPPCGCQELCHPHLSWGFLLRGSLGEQQPGSVCGSGPSGRLTRNASLIRLMPWRVGICPKRADRRRSHAHGRRFSHGSWRLRGGQGRSVLRRDRRRSARGRRAINMQQLARIARGQPWLIDVTRVGRSARHKPLPFRLPS